MDVTPTWQSVVELAAHPVAEIRTAALRELHRLAGYLDKQRDSGSDHHAIDPGSIGEE
ncbi:hypothetical protein [Lacipirellula limnantheis]|uniref:Uncharacterized protein n=1 Tax=Lacipirellula limnantheis TaxID=2528024 RepID=A0A517U2J4_9BACT|nr:hypothetical protein [Lacipirellula limnantheis]QDT74836.1 hypothetical protein I41_40390 [Lacipirellula limnantheis]